MGPMTDERLREIRERMKSFGCYQASDADDLLAEVDRLREERRWRAIDTAPTNESVLVYIPNAEHYGEGIYRAIQVDMGTGRRWTTCGLHIGRDLGSERATHWLPLPDAPDSAVPPIDWRSVARELMTALWGCGDKGGWSREDIQALARTMAEKWPEIRPGAGGGDGRVG